MISVQPDSDARHCAASPRSAQNGARASRSIPRRSCASKSSVESQALCYLFRADPCNEPVRGKRQRLGRQSPLDFRLGIRPTRPRTRRISPTTPCTLRFLSTQTAVAHRTSPCPPSASQLLQPCFVLERPAPNLRP